MTTLRTAPFIKMPDIGKIQDQATKMVLEQLVRFLYDNQRKVYDDLNNSSGVGADPIYIGDKDTDGSWKMTVVGNNLVVFRRESSVWVEKSAFTP